MRTTLLLVIRSKSQVVVVEEVKSLVRRSEKEDNCLGAERERRERVYERSLSNTQNGPSMPGLLNFASAEMIPSGFLIRPCEGGGSIIHIVDHMNLEALCQLRQVDQ
ncbi:hypothetical protein LguiB_012727 [Lonicera macranthoides]